MGQNWEGTKNSRDMPEILYIFLEIKRFMPIYGHIFTQNLPFSVKKKLLEGILKTKTLNTSFWGTFGVHWGSIGF